MGEFYQTQSKYQANVTELSDKLYGQKPQYPYHTFNMLYCALNLNVGIAVEAHTNGTYRNAKVYVLIHEGWDIVKNMYLKNQKSMKRIPLLGGGSGALGLMRFMT